MPSSEQAQPYSHAMVKREIFAGLLALGAGFLVTISPCIGYTGSGENPSLLPFALVAMAIWIAGLFACVSLVAGLICRVSSVASRRALTRKSLHMSTRAGVITLGLCSGLITGIHATHWVRNWN